MDVNAALGLLDGLGRLDEPGRVAAYSIDHVRDATGARFAELVTARRGADLAVLASSDADLTAELMRAREEAEAPPTPEAGLAGSVVVVEDLVTASPWEAFAALAVERTPIRSALLPYLLVDARTAVVLPVADDRPGYFTADRQAYVRLVCGLTARVLRGLADAESLASLGRGLEARARVGTAVGVLVSRRSLSPDEAFDLLRRRSQRTGRRVRDLAERVIADGDLEHDPDDPAGPV